MFEKLFSKGKDASEGNRYLNVDIYVRKPTFMTPSADDAFELALWLNLYPLTYSGVEAPDEPCISVRQYDRLPSHLKVFFERKSVSLMCF